MDNIFADEISFLFIMKMFDILYHSVISKVMFLIIRFYQDFGDQYKWNHQILYSVDIIVIEEAVCDSEWIVDFRNIENILVLSNTMRFQVLYDFVVDIVSLIAIGELLIYLVCDLCF